MVFFKMPSTLRIWILSKLVSTSGKDFVKKNPNKEIIILVAIKGLAYLFNESFGCVVTSRGVHTFEEYCSYKEYRFHK